MKRRLRIGTFTSALLLGLAPSVFAQSVPGVGVPADLANIIPYTGLLTPNANVPPLFPNTWITPNYLFDYQVPRVVYVPVAVPVRPPLAAVQPIQVTPVTLRKGPGLTSLEVTPGTVVTWNNADNQAINLVVAQSTPAGSGGSGTASQTWPIRANGSFSLVFNQPGTYDYYRLDEPTHRARIVVTG